MLREYPVSKPGLASAERIVFWRVETVVHLARCGLRRQQMSRSSSDVEPGPRGPAADPRREHVNDSGFSFVNSAR